jgi:hypothetical protein
MEQKYLAVCQTFFNKPLTSQGISERAVGITFLTRYYQRLQDSYWFLLTHQGGRAAAASAAVTSVQKQSTHSDATSHSRRGEASPYFRAFAIAPPPPSKRRYFCHYQYFVESIDRIKIRRQLLRVNWKKETKKADRKLELREIRRATLANESEFRREGLVTLCRCLQ